jgi:hypothetical protein
MVVDEPAQVVTGVFGGILPVGRPFVSACHRFAQLRGAQTEHVQAVIPVGQRHIERVTDDRDVRHGGHERQAVKRRVRLDEAARGLSVEQREDLVFGAHEHVEPRRDRADRWQLGRVAQEHADDLLRPRGSALRRRGDDDVVVAQRKTLPTGAIGHEAVVVTHRRAW